MIIYKLLKEPLFHFLVLGGLLYLASILSGYNDTDTQRIIVSQGQVRHIAILYEKTWQRKPTKAELQALVQDYIKSQAAYYEGMRMGLEKDDVVITRRLRQKINFIAEEKLERPAVTDDILQAYLQQHADRFRTDPILSIRQVYFDPSRGEQESDTQLRKLLSELAERPDEDIENRGQRYIFKPYYINQTLTDLKRVFGEDFANAVLKAEAGVWTGPIQSAFGSHLVYIDKKQEGFLPALSSIYDQVFKEWQNSLREQSIDTYYAELLKRYPVTVHWPEDEALIIAKKMDE